MNIPNSVSLFRILLVPVAMWLIINDEMRAAFLVFVIAGVSDAVDGYLAKTYGWETELGAYLDPMADKLLLISIFAALGFLGELPSWLVLVVIFRDIIMVAAIVLAWMLDNPVEIKPIAISKINTALQIILVSTVLADAGFALGQADLRLILGWCTGITTVLSGAAYLRTWISHMAGYGT
ncbi:MAG: CDP-alcohol phosphatidyltransferase family protein [Hyphomicrobiaceae bacterium]